MMIIDGHEDLAYNAMVDGRDYMTSALAIRAAEAERGYSSPNGVCMLGLPEWLAGGVQMVFTTLLAIPKSRALPNEPGYTNPEEAWRIGVAQMDVYEQWVAEHPQVALVAHRSQLNEVLASWRSGRPDERQVGLVLLIENADLIRSPAEVAEWYERGVRLIGPAWHTNRYTGSSMDPGPLTDLGRELLQEMDHHGVVLDLSHMADEACLEALDTFAGRIVATHANPRRMVPRFRLLSDEVIARLVERDGVIGIMPANWGLDPDWKHKTKADIHLDTVVDAIDIVCEIAGDTRHVAIGTDFDGGQGAECAPHEIDTIADLPRLAQALAQRQYADSDIENIMGGNWLRLMQDTLPA